MQVVSSREEFQWLLLLVMGFLLSLLPESFLWMGCLSVVLLVGLPHGALDVYLLWFNDKEDLFHFIKSISQYICLVLGALLFWRLIPELFWALFFLAACYHFGSTDEHPKVLAAISQRSYLRIIWILSRGTLLVFTPAVFHPEKISGYLSYAAPSLFGKQMVAVAPFLCSYSAVFFLWTTIQSWRRAPLRAYRFLLIKHLFSLLVLLLLFAVADPLLSFSLYFCCHHSLTHTFRVLSRFRGKVRGTWLVFWGTLITLCVVPLLWWIPKQMVLGVTPDGLVTGSFVAIAALTFPHLLVVKDMHKRSSRRFQAITEI